MKPPDSRRVFRGRDGAQAGTVQRDETACAVSQKAHDNRREATLISPARLPGSMTTRTLALVGSLVFFWVAPDVVGGVGPFALVVLDEAATAARASGRAGSGCRDGRGGSGLPAGLFARFVLEGPGTPARMAQIEGLVYRRTKVGQCVDGNQAAELTANA